jgi:hypothetical protein
LQFSNLLAVNGPDNDREIFTSFALQLGKLSIAMIQVPIAVLIKLAELVVAGITKMISASQAIWAFAFLIRNL